MSISEVACWEAVVKRCLRERFTVTDKMPFMNIKKAKQYPEILRNIYDAVMSIIWTIIFFMHSDKEIMVRCRKWYGFGFLSKLKAKRRIRRIGYFYYDNAKFLDQVPTEHSKTELVQLQINYDDWDDIGIQSRKCYEVRRRHGKQVIVMEPLKGGILHSFRRRL